MHITISFDTDGDTAAEIYELLAKAHHQARAGSIVAAPPPDALTPVPPDVAKANRQAAAANARAAKDKSKPKEGPVEKVLGPDAAPPNGQDQEVDDMGLVPPAMSPGEARDAALALVREAYAAGHVAEVKALQKEYQVAKFYDVPVEQGHTFYARVMKLAQATGIRK